MIEKQTSALRDELGCAHETIDRLERQVLGLTTQLDHHQIRAREEMISCVDQAKRSIHRTIQTSVVPQLEARIDAHASKAEGKLGGLAQLEADCSGLMKQVNRLHPTVNASHEANDTHARQIHSLQESLHAHETATQRRVAALEAALEEASASSSQAVEAVDPVWDRFEAFAAEEERKDKEEKDRQGAASLALALLAAGCIVLLRKVTTC